MKKHAFVLALPFLLGMALASCNGTTPGSESETPKSEAEVTSSTATPEEENAEIRRIYDAYVRNALADGDTPLDYED